MYHRAEHLRMTDSSWSALRRSYLRITDLCNYASYFSVDFFPQSREKFHQSGFSFDLKRASRINSSLRESTCSIDAGYKLIRQSLDFRYDQLFSGRNLRTTAPVRHISLSRRSFSSASRPSL
jgi:hypothetical protein